MVSKSPIICPIFKKNRDSNVYLVTNDLSLKIRASSLNIDCFSLPDELEIKDQNDPVIKENLKLKRELEVLKSKIPKLKVVFPNKKQHETFKLKKWDFEVHKSERIDELKKQYPYMNLENDENREKKGLGLLQMDFRSRFMIPTKEQIAEYNDGLSTYFYDYENYLDDIHEYLLKQHLSFDLKFELINEGNSPANDVDILLHFPDGSILYDSDDFPEPPDEPNPPHEPTGLLGTAITPVLSGHLFQNPIQHVSPGIINFDKLSIKKTNSYDVEYGVKSLKHNQSHEMQHLILAFESYDSASSFEIEYAIYAANIPNVVKGNLNFILKK